MIKKALIAVAVLAVAGIVAGVVRAKMLAAATNNQTQYRVQRADYTMVKKTVSATGKLQPWRTVDIKSKAGGRVDALLVDVGSTVRKGQVLARIDPSDTQLSVDQARADIETADAKIRQSTVTWDLQKQQSRLAVSQAQISYEGAQAALHAAEARLVQSGEQRDAQPQLSAANIASAQANVDSAEKQLAQLREATHPQARASAKAALDQAKANMLNAQANLRRQQKLLDKGYVSQQTVDQAQATFDVSSAQVDNAQRKLDTLDSELAADEAAQVARVRQAQAQLRNAQAGAVDVEVRKSAVLEAQANVRQARKTVENARAALALARANVANNEVRRADITSANAGKLRAVASYGNAAKTLDQTIVRAPSEGVILQKYVEQGTIISSALSFAATGNNIVQLGDVTRMYVDVSVDETDIASVDVDQPVDITVDAYPGVPFEGKVSRIDPQAQVDQNVTTVHVRVELDNSSSSYRLLKPQMNATCEFILGKKENVLSVPSDAIRSDDKGQYVQVATGGKPAPDSGTDATSNVQTLVGVALKRRDVQVGLEGNDDVEVTSGVNQGDMVVTQTIEPTTAAAGPTGAMGGFGPRGMGGRR